MAKRGWIVAAVLLAAGAAAAYQTRASWYPERAAAKVALGPRKVVVEVAKAVRQPVPVAVESIGTVTPISSVALKSRIETTIVAVHFEDGARVKQGDLLFTLDARQIDAQIEQAEGALARDRAQLAGAQRDLQRYSELIGKGATTQVNLDNAKTHADTLTGSKHANMKELRCNAADGVWRIAFAFDPDRQAILLVGGGKSGGTEKRFYKQLNARADERCDSHPAKRKG